MDNQSNFAQDGTKPAPNLNMEDQIHDSIEKAKEVLPEKKNGSPWKKIVLTGLLIGVFGGVSYFATTNNLFSGNLFTDGFKAEQAEDFFPQEVEKFTKIKIPKKELRENLLVNTWEHIIDEYLNGEIAFSKSKITYLWEGEDLEILAASWNKGSQNLVAAKLDENKLKSLLAKNEYKNTFYAGVLLAQGPRVLSQSRQDIEAERGTVRSASGAESEETQTPQEAEAAEREEDSAVEAEQETEATEQTEKETEATRSATDQSPRTEAGREESRGTVQADEREEEKTTKTQGEETNREEQSAPQDTNREETQEAVSCFPDKKFCIAGNYLLLGNGITEAGRIIKSNSPKIISNEVYKNLNDKFKTKSSSLIASRETTFLISSEEINKYYEQEKLKKISGTAFSDKSAQSGQKISYTLSASPEKGALKVMEKASTDIALSFDFNMSTPFTGTSNIVLSICALNYKNQYNQDCYTLLNTNKEGKEISEKFTVSKDTLFNAAKQLQMSFFDQTADDVKFKIAIAQNDFYEEAFKEGFSLTSSQTFAAINKSPDILYGVKEGDVFKYKENGYKDDDKDKGKGVVVMQAYLPGYSGEEPVQISTQICSDKIAGKCKLTNSREVPLNPYVGGNTMLQSVANDEIADAIYSLDLPVILEDQNEEATSIYIRFAFSDENTTNELCTSSDSACTEFKHFKAVAKAVFAETAAEKIEEINNKVKTLKEQILAEKPKAEQAQQDTLKIAVELAGKYSGQGITQEATLIYGKANVQANNQNKIAKAAIESIDKLALDTEALLAQVAKAKYQAQIAETKEKADTQLASAQQILIEAEAKLSAAQQQVEVASKAFAAAQKIAEEAEEEVKALADGGLKEEVVEEKSVPAHLIDEWDPKDDTLENATLISISDSLEENKEDLHGIHQFSPPYNETVDWFKAELQAGKKYTFTTNETEKTKLSLADASLSPACSKSGGNQSTSDKEIIYQPKVTETICFKVETLGEQNFPYSLVYKYANDKQAAPKPMFSENAFVPSVKSPAELTFFTDAETPASQIVLEGSKGVELLKVRFNGSTEATIINKIQLGIAGTHKQGIYSSITQIPVKSLYLTDEANPGQILSTCEPDAKGVALCSNIKFKVPAESKANLIVKGDIIALADTNSTANIPTGTVFNVAVKNILDAHKESDPTQKIPLEVKMPLNCTANFASNAGSATLGLIEQQISPKCDKELEPGDIIFMDEKEYILIADKKTEEDKEEYLLSRKAYDSSAFIGAKQLSEAGQKLKARSGLFMFRASKPIIETLNYDNDKSLGKNLSKGIYKFQVGSAKNKLSIGAVTFEITGKLGGQKIAEANNSDETYVLDLDHAINMKDANGITKATIHKFDLKKIDGDQNPVLPVDFKYYHDNVSGKNYLFANLLEDLEVSETPVTLELYAKITGDLIKDKDYLNVRIPAVLNAAQHINDSDLSGNKPKAHYRKFKATGLKSITRTLLPDFIDDYEYSLLDEKEQKNIVKKFLIFDDFIWSDRDTELRNLSYNQKQFYFNLAQNFMGGWLLDTLPSGSQTLTY